MTVTGDLDEWYSTRQVASLFHVTTETVVNWIKKGQLPATRINGRWRIKRADVVAFGNAKYSS